MYLLDLIQSTPQTKQDLLRVVGMYDIFSKEKGEKERREIKMIIIKPNRFLQRKII